MGIRKTLHRYIWGTTDLNFREFYVIAGSLFCVCCMGFDFIVSLFSFHVTARVLVDRVLLGICVLAIITVSIVNVTENHVFVCIDVFSLVLCMIVFIACDCAGIDQCYATPFV
ncbi:hypothetical protein POJ06DRAFT_114710 [Lipomyces tetrasporus]|uniref:Uncharacterized protein n=1 Tax=Lipomyces tetrasporus TaxID=54092 RepID=A0AAD7VR80_9ASCO|nr:uncharacterized protein POJ06DRAFT_114710 [Lipomyces tetrasporus]KAJ8099682.1 hypothetical protein POJ06DRAFT_114710 [Lipomyces tetrasporus]